MAAALGVLVALLAVGVAVGESTGWPVLREPVARGLARAFGVPVLVQGGFEVRLLPTPAVRAEQVTVGAAAGVPVPHLLHAGRLEARTDWSTLWRWWRGEAGLHVRSLSAEEVDAHLVRLADGRASWQLGAGRAEAEPRADRPPREPPRIDRLTVGQGRIRFADAGPGTDLRLDVQGGEGGQVGDGGQGYRATLGGRFRAMPLQLDLRSGRLLPLLAPGNDAAQTLQPLAVQGRVGAAEVSFDGAAADLLGGRRIEGQLQLAGPSLARVAEPLGVTLPHTPPFDLRAGMRHEDGRWLVQVARARIGRSELAGELSYDSRVRPPRLTGRLAGPRLVLSDLGPAVGTDGPRAPAKVLPQRPFDLASLRIMDADVALQFERLELGTSLLNALVDVRTQVRLDNGVLALSPLEASLGGGRLSGRTRLDGRDRTARWTAEIALRGVDVAQWAPAARERARLTGRLEADLSIRAVGLSSAALLASTDGQVRARLRDGTLSHLVTEGAGLDVAEALGLMVVGDRTLPLRCTALDAALEDGVARITRGLVDNRDSTIAIAGRVHLRGERLELVMRTRPKDFSPISVRSPITLTGTFAQPRLGIDRKRTAGRVLGALVLGAVVGPVAALLPLADTGDPPQSDPCAGEPR